MLEMMGDQQTTSQVHQLPLVWMVSSYPECHLRLIKPVEPHDLTLQPYSTMSMMSLIAFFNFATPVNSIPYPIETRVG